LITGKRIDMSDTADKDLIDADEWNERWQRSLDKPVRQLPFKFLEPAVHRRLMWEFRKYLPPGEINALEVGCASGRWMVRFAKEMKYHVYGIDYSNAGCRTAKANLDRCGIEAKVINGNLFDSAFQKNYYEFFDLVYSFGFIEHFTDTYNVLRAHLDLLESGGILIVTVPNFSKRSFYRGRMYRIMNRSDNLEHLESTHNTAVMEIDYLKNYLEMFKDLKILKIGYVGPVSLPGRYRLLSFLVNQLVGYLTFFLDSKMFSAHMLLIAKKQ
jgi:2-polyprenyl-3-methyl-5-hydroxy-6-metoxy-1,4-benzoquinol methylase